MVSFLTKDSKNRFYVHQVKRGQTEIRQLQQKKVKNVKTPKGPLAKILGLLRQNNRQKCYPFVMLRMFFFEKQIQIKTTFQLLHLMTLMTHGWRHLDRIRLAYLFFNNAVFQHVAPVRPMRQL